LLLFSVGSYNVNHIFIVVDANTVGTSYLVSGTALVGRAEATTVETVLIK